MPMNGNENKYQEIFNKKKANPALSLAQLCKDAGTTYQSYNNWVKKQHRTREPVTGQGHLLLLRVAVQISIAEFANLIMSGGKALPVRVDSILAGLPAAERRQLAEYLGNLRLERAQATAQARQSQDLENGEDATA